MTCEDPSGPTQDLNGLTLKSVGRLCLWSGSMQRDVKNEGTSGDVYENAGKRTKCIPPKCPFLHERVPIDRPSAKIERT